MRVILREHPEEIGDEELERLIATLPEWRREVATRYKFRSGRVLSALAYHLLCQGLREEYGMEEMPAFEYGPHGKPSIAGHPDIHFNLSHCKQGVICVIDDRPVGVDIESVREKFNEDLCRHCFNDSEVSDILSAPDPRLRFTNLWTRKEAVTKCSGNGLISDLKAILNTENVKDLTLETHEHPEEGYVYTICRTKR